MDRDVCALREERLSVQVAGSWRSPPSGGLAHSVELGCARWAPVQATVPPEAVTRGGQPESSSPWTQPGLSHLHFWKGLSGPVNPGQTRCQACV